MLESNASQKTSQDPRRRSRHRVLLLGALFLIAITTLLLVLPSMTPGWFQLADPDDETAADHGQQVEFRLAEEFQLIRPESETWRLRIRDEDLNAWLSTRLLPWLSHEQNFTWPEGVSRPQIRFTSTGVQVAARVEDLLGGDRVVTLGFQPEIIDDQLVLHPGGASIGRLPVPFARAAIEALLKESLSVGEEALAGLAARDADTASLEAVIPLVDSRQVRLNSLKFESGAVVLDAITVRNPQ